MAKGNYLKRGINYLKRNGPVQTFYKGLERMRRDADEADYVPHFADAAQLALQREHVFMHPYRISILVPVYETDPGIFRLMLESVGKQTYGNWELILADASRDESRRAIILAFMEEYNLSCRDSFGSIHDKVRYIRTDAKGISENTNEALANATGDYIALLDHDDILDNSALFDIMSAIETKEQKGISHELIEKVMLIYTDEDKVSADGTRYFDPHIKPGFDPVLLCTNNYICHFCVADTSLAKSVGGFRTEYDGAQDHDFILRCTENIRRDQIIHVPTVSYHWRSTEGSTAENPQSKLYAYEAGKRAVEDHLRRRGIKAAVSHSPHLGFYDIEYDIDPENRIKDEGPEYEMILSPDLEPADKGYLEDMMSCMCIPFIGAVTGKIIGTDRKVESAGFDQDGENGIKPRFAGLNSHFSGPMHRACLDQIVAGASPDCVLIRKDAIETMSPRIVLKEGYDIYYRHRAVFRRRSR